MRWAAGVVGTAAVLGLVVLGWALRRQLLLRRARLTGAVARGTCTARWAVEAGAQGREARAWHRSYEFRPEGRDASVVLEEVDAGDAAPGEAVEVRYLPGRPEVAVVAARVGRAVVVQAVGAGVLLAVAGVAVGDLVR
ncbi:hypothetical protein BIV57_17055 [Mangrovactinospora gilvigrisea]|uniref:DUF3592 domain-containing protein n=1 Tax=Mangrovactinospora gilvigrisea TaxID=1428644 RepID=A0A1J7C3Z0_9ACTN|nr:DUF3592 domain-containing protein [Mangrovactinospora gilvigrisea]OIV36284.1 hypothetical protein BIV57_17055 [Mangrovactinospora gilvigrisea]